MKVKNIKVGVRVVSKVDYLSVCVGDVGTVLEEDNYPYVKWDRTDANFTSYRGTPCTSLPFTALRKYKV